MNSFAAVTLMAGAAAGEWEPARDSMLTEWGERITPDAVWNVYPRPQMKRNSWINLNGLWQYTVTPEKSAKPDQWDGHILVPFCIESALSGVKRHFSPEEALWHRRSLKLNKQTDHRYLLNFEAVDYGSTAWVNGKKIGSNTGGNLPFSFDATDALMSGENEIIMRVTDATDADGAYQLSGKQRLDPKGIWYTPVSGIWQTVWLEEVPENFISSLKIDTGLDGKVAISVQTSGDSSGLSLSAVVSLDGRQVAKASGAPSRTTIQVPDPQLWSPDSPILYELEIALGEDRISSYFGIREVGKIRGADGHWRMTLNGEEIFHFGTLDQGWWPDGLLTPPSYEAMCSDVDFLKAAGFNTIRKHIKVEPRLYYYYCDKAGMMVWQDQVAAAPPGRSPEWTRLKPDPEQVAWPEAAHQQYMKEHREMIDVLYNHPSIVQWIPFNERWGQHRSMEVGEWVTAYDPSRLVNISSGGNFWPVGDIVDHHQYPHPRFPFDLGRGGRFDDYIKVVGEFGGHGFPVRGHLWDPDSRNWGYGGLPKDKDEWVERYRTSIRKLSELRSRGITAGIYTQTTDVEGEINGLITYDRKLRKISAEELAELHARLLPDSASSVAPAVKPAMSREEIEKGLVSRDRALYIKQGWIRDPYIILGPDDFFYLTGTTPDSGDPREQSDPYNIGLGKQSIVGTGVRVWRSRDLVDWESLGAPFTLQDSWHENPGNRVWAPEMHWLGNRWALVHCPGRKANFVLTDDEDFRGPWTHPMGEKLGRKHDPSLFRDDDGTWYMLWGNTFLAPLKHDFSAFAAEPTRIDPAGTRPGPDGKPISRIGHEGATMRKIGKKYVHFGTAWSTDRGRKGSYNLYYCTSDRITGPYGPRKFAGRFLGHGTPFQTRDGKWWCTAFFNANVPPIPREGIQTRDLSENAQTINRRGTTIVPLEVKILDDGDVYIRAEDPAYAAPGPDEVQEFQPPMRPRNR